MLEQHQLVIGARRFVAGGAGVLILTMGRGRASSCKAGSLASSPFIRFEHPSMRTSPPQSRIAAGSTLQGTGPFSGSACFSPERGRSHVRPALPLCGPGDLENSGDDSTGRNKASRRVAPERDQQFACQCDNHGPTNTACCAICPFIKPAREAALRLPLQPPPSELYHVCAKCCGTAFGDALISAHSSACPRCPSKTATGGDFSPIPEFSPESFANKH